MSETIKRRSVSGQLALAFEPLVPPKVGVAGFSDFVLLFSGVIEDAVT